MSRPSRSGTLVVYALVSMAIVAALLGNSVKSALRIRQWTRQQLQLVQTQVLCDAGVQRAVSNLRNDEDYAGETWLPDMSEAGWHAAEVAIHVAPLREGSSRRIHVTARLGGSDPQAAECQRSEEVIYDPSPDYFTGE
jgi:hypothetical protein